MSEQKNLLSVFVARHLRLIEWIGILMRIMSFGTVSWLGPDSPFLLVWIINTTDAVMLTWCSWLKRDSAYTFLNSFWISSA